MNIRNSSLNEREFELINIIGSQLANNQRNLSTQMDISLGMTNMLLRRMIAKGYIRIQQLNSRKIQYILTSKGFTEKMRKSVKYTIKTLNSISFIKTCLRDMMSALYIKGQREFWVLATVDLSQLIEMVAKEGDLANCQIHYINEWLNQTSQGVLLIGKENVQVQSTDTLQVIDVMHELSKDGLLIAKAEENI